MVKDGYDLAIRMGLNRTRKANRKSLLTVKRCMVAATSYLEKQGMPLKPEDLNSFKWAVLSPVRTMKPVLKKSGEQVVQIRPQASLEANDALALYRFILAGAGVGIVPDFLTKEDESSGKVSVLFPDWELEKLDVFAEWPLNIPEKGLVRLLVDRL